MKKIWLLVLTLIVCFTFIGSTRASFVDIESSISNSFSATFLDFSLKDVDDGQLISPLFNISGIIPEGTETKTVRIKKEGGEDFKYRATAVKTSGDDGLCTSLQIEAKHEGIVRYSGSLLGLSFTPITISGDQDDWDFTISLNDSAGSLRTKTCDFDLRINGWQTDSDGTWGFSDQESIGNRVISGTWEVSSLGSVVINEIMWMGSTESTADEWIELRNMTDHEIDIGKWTLDNTKDGGDRKLMIPASGSIPANGYFLIANYPKTSANSVLNVEVDEVANLELLNSENGNIVLKDNNGTIIDQAKGDNWPVGENGTDKKSMERNNVPGDGTQASNWHTCINSACNDTIYWDSEANNYGTPKAANLSENDPTSPDFVPSLTPVVEVSASATLNINPVQESTSSASVVSLPSEAPTPTPASEPSPTPTATPEISPSTDPKPAETTPIPVEPEHKEDAASVPPASSPASTEDVNKDPAI